MEADELSMDEEVFLGEITERERNHPTFNSRRRTTVYFPGVSRPDSSFSIHREFTDDGTLIFSCEEETDQECSAVDKSCNASEGSEPQSTFLTLSKRGEKSQKSDSFTDKLFEESDMDSGFSSVSDANLTPTAVSPFPILALSEGETESSIMTPETKLKGNRVLTLSEDGQRRHRQMSPAVVTGQLQSPCLLVNPSPKTTDHFHDTSAVKQHILCNESSVTAVTISPSNPLSVSKTTSAFSKLKLESPKCDLSSDPETPYSAESPAKDGSCMSPIPSNHQGVLPKKRKVAQRSPLAELKTDINDDVYNKAENKTKEKNNSVTLPGEATLRNADSNCHISHSCLFGLTSAERKLQQLHQDCDDQILKSAEKMKSVSPLKRKLSAGDDMYVMKQIQHDISQVLVPNTPDIKTSSLASSERDLNLSRFLMQSQPEEDDLDTVPSSQKTETDASPIVNKLPASVSKTNKVDLCSSTPNMESSLLSVNRHVIQTNVPMPPSPDLLFSQTTPLSANRHAVRTYLSTELSPDLFCSPCADKSSDSVLPPTPKASRDPVHSPVPGLTVSFLKKQEFSPQPMQSIPEEQIKAKYGRLAIRKPKITTSRRENKENRAKLYGSVFLSSSFVQLPEAEPPTTALNNPEATLSRPRKKHKSATYFAMYEKSNDAGLSFEEPAPQSSPADETEYRHTAFSAEQLEADSRATMTRINTMINGETRHSLLDPQSSPALLTEFPPPKEATRISWSDHLIEEPSVSLEPVQTPLTPRSILQQRAADHKFPFSKDPPSPIVLTRRRLPKFTRIFTFEN